MEAVRALLAEHFPEAAGYEATWFRLSGPIEGTTVRLQRGRFRAALSVQRFVRAHHPSPAGAAASACAPTPVEIRVVASAQIAPPEGCARAQRPTAGWGTTSYALAVTACGALGLGAAGALELWMQAALLVPALVAWRARGSVAPTPARAAIAAPARRARRRPPAQRDALARWRRLLEPLSLQRDLLDHTSGLAPFRAQPRPVSAPA